MENIQKMIALGFALLIIALIIIIVIFIVIGVILNKLNKLMYGKGTALAFIPLCQTYLLGKLTINKIAGWVLIVLTFVFSQTTTTINGVKVDRSIIKNATLRNTLSTILTVIELGLVIYAIYKYVKLKKQAVTGNVAAAVAQPVGVLNGAVDQTNPFAAGNQAPSMAAPVASPNVGQPINTIQQGVNTVSVDPFQPSASAPMSNQAPADPFQANASANPQAPSNSGIDPNATIDSIIQHSPDTIQMEPTISNPEISTGPTMEPTLVSTPIPEAGQPSTVPQMDINSTPVDTNNPNNM